MRTVILASQSPRRRELLEQMGVGFTVEPSDFHEELDDQRPPETVAIELALGKARIVAQRHPDAVVIGSDTIVTIDGHQLAKPHDTDEARTMLRDLSGRANAVTTGLAVICLDERLQLTGAETGQVYFRPYDADAVEAYVATGDPLDKAGGYGLQSGAAPLIERLEGRTDTIVGLPTQLLAKFLGQAGIPAKAVDLPSPLDITT